MNIPVILRWWIIKMETQFEFIARKIIPNICEKPVHCESLAKCYRGELDEDEINDYAKKAKIKPVEGKGRDASYSIPDSILLGKFIAAEIKKDCRAAIDKYNKIQDEQIDAKYRADSRRQAAALASFEQEQRIAAALARLAAKEAS